MAAADVLDALLSKRPYKEALSVDETLSAIKPAVGQTVRSESRRSGGSDPHKSCRLLTPSGIIRVIE